MVCGLLTVFSYVERFREETKGSPKSLSLGLLTSVEPPILTFNSAACQKYLASSPVNVTLSFDSKVK